MVFVAYRGEDDDRHVAPLPKALAELDPVAVGEQQVDDRGVDGRGCYHVNGLVHVCSCQDHISGVTQDDLQCAQDLRLVITGENPPAG